MKNKRRWLRRLLAIALIFALFGYAAVLFAGYEINKRVKAEVARRLPKVEERTGLHLSLGEVKVSLTGNSVIHDVTVQQDELSPTPIAHIPKMEVLLKVNWWKRTANLKGVRLDDPSFFLEVLPDGKTNLSALLDKLTNSKAEQADEDPPHSHRLGLNPELELLVDGGRFTIRDEGLISQTQPLQNSFRELQGTLTIDLDHHGVRILGEAEPSGGKGKVLIDAALNEEHQQAQFIFKDFDVGRLVGFVPLPVKIGDGAGLNGHLQLNKNKTSPLWLITSDLSVSRLSLSHPRLASTEVREIGGGLQGQIVFNPAGRAVQTADLTVLIGSAPFHLVDTEIRYPAQGPFFLRTTVQARQTPIQQMLEGLPRDLIPILAGAVVDGRMLFTASLIIDMVNINHSEFKIDGLVEGFKVRAAPPRANVRAILQPDYLHLARKHGLLEKEIVVGPNNPDFVPLENLGGYLKGAALTCEDGSFFHHHGFLWNHVNDSLRRNLREKRFVRGASTISMQTVKNLFLSEEKTLSRKLQEAMLTWWLEREVRKERILETYFNIIEWGPKIYGAGPAARHYFGCAPSRLAPLEAAFMASIISNPVRYHYMKDRRSVGGWDVNMAFIMRKMMERGTITEDDYLAAEKVGFDPFVKPGEEPAAVKPAAPAEPPLDPDFLEKLEEKADLPPAAAPVKK